MRRLTRAFWWLSTVVLVSVLCDRSVASPCEMILREGRPYRVENITLHFLSPATVEIRYDLPLTQWQRIAPDHLLIKVGNWHTDKYISSTVIAANKTSFIAKDLPDHDLLEFIVLPENEQPGCRHDKIYLTISSQAVDCGDPGSPINGKRELGNTTLNSRVTFTCDPGYRMKGELEAVCLPTGPWSPPSPHCIIVDCGDPPAYTNLDFRAATCYKCDPGCNVVGSNVHNCSANATWNSKAPSCEKITCDDPGVPANGERIGEDFSYKDNVAFYCNNNFQLNGQPSAVCQANGTWSNPLPNCDPDCLVSEYGPIGPCNGTCGDGTRDQTRTIKQKPAGLGRQCPPLVKSQSCDPCIYVPFWIYIVSALPCVIIPAAVLIYLLCQGRTILSVKHSDAKSFFLDHFSVNLSSADNATHLDLPYNCPLAAVEDVLADKPTLYLCYGHSFPSPGGRHHKKVEQIADAVYDIGVNVKFPDWELNTIMENVPEWFEEVEKSPIDGIVVVLSRELVCLWQQASIHTGQKTPSQRLAYHERRFVKSAMERSSPRVITVVLDEHENKTSFEIDELIPDLLQSCDVQPLFWQLENDNTLIWEWLLDFLGSSKFQLNTSMNCTIALPPDITKNEEEKRSLPVSSSSPSSSCVIDMGGPLPLAFKGQTVVMQDETSKESSLPSLVVPAVTPDLVTSSLPTTSTPTFSTMSSSCTDFRTHPRIRTANPEAADASEAACIRSVSSQPSLMQSIPPHGENGEGNDDGHDDGAFLTMEEPASAAVEGSPERHTVPDTSSDAVAVNRPALAANQPELAVNQPNSHISCQVESGMAGSNFASKISADQPLASLFLSSDMHRQAVRPPPILPEDGAASRLAVNAVTQLQPMLLQLSRQVSLQHQQNSSDSELTCEAEGMKQEGAARTPTASQSTELPAPTCNRPAYLSWLQKTL